MTTWDVIQLFLGALSAGALLLLKMLWARMQTIEKTAAEAATGMTNFRVEVAQNYVRYDVLKTVRDEIINHLDRLESKLDRKVDKD